MTTTQPQEPQAHEITRAQWDSFPRECKRTWKNGTRLVLMRRPGSGEAEWVKVFWRR